MRGFVDYQCQLKLREIFELLEEGKFEQYERLIGKAFRLGVSRGFVEDLLEAARKIYDTDQDFAEHYGWADHTSVSKIRRSGKVSSVVIALFLLRHPGAIRFDTVKWKKRGYQEALNASRHTIENSGERVSDEDIDRLFRLFSSTPEQMLQNRSRGPWALHFLLCVSILAQEETDGRPT